MATCAIGMAKFVRGVRSVRDELLADPRDRSDDDQVRGGALQALISSPDVPDDTIDVRVDDGWLTPRGRVKRREESNAACEAGSGLPGVGGFTNRIQVVTACGS